MNNTFKTVLRDSVLIIDDQAASRAVLEQLVRNLNAEIQVQCCENPVDALDWATSQVADLVLVDYRMQEIDGIELVRRLRLLPQYTHVPMVMVTVDHNPEVRYSALDVGVTDFLTKPIDLRECLARCRNLLTLRRQQRLLEDRGRHLLNTVQTATQHLHEHEFRYRSVMESSLDGFWVLNKEGRIQDVNASYVCRSGYSREELLGMQVYDLEAKQSPDDVRHSLASYGHRGARIFETWHRAKDGTVWPVEVSTVSVPDNGLYCTFLRDISERKRAEATQATLAAIVGSTNDAIIGRSLDGTIISWNTAAERLLGYASAETIGTDGGAIFPSARQEEILANRELMKAGQAVPDQENVDITRDGRRVDVLRSTFPIKESNGLIIGTATILRDISERKRAEATQETLAAIVANTNDAIIGRGLDGKIISWNAAAERMLGYTAAEVIGSDTEAIFGPSQREEVLANRELIKAGKSVPDRDSVRIAKDGRRVDVTVSILPIKDSSRLMIGTAIVLRDITERKRSEEAMQLASLAFNSSVEAMMVTAMNGDIIAVNPAFAQITGYAPDEVIGKHPRFLESNRHDEAFYHAMRQQLVATGSWQGEVWERRKNGDVFPMWLSINTASTKDGSPIRRVSLFYDLTEKKKSEEIIWRQANFDSLTGLPNRRMFTDRLDQEIKKSNRAGLPLALIFLDLDRFKEVNDTLGHDMGDVLLKEAARRLTGGVRETDTVARLGGDEFTIILGELDEIRSVERVAQNILRKLAEPFQLAGEQAYVSASIGITLYPEDATEIDALLRNADQAMYAAKRQGRNRRSYFTHSMQEAAQNRMRLAADLRGALADNQFIVYYQPIVELATGAVRKAEALIRWQHPARGLISPAEFIPIAEDTGTINDIGDWVFYEAARQVERWRLLFGADFQISINTSPVQFRSEGRSHGPWVDHLRARGLPGQSIVVEITEGLLMEANSAVSSELIGFRDAGIQVALDDFGTGYSSLSYLKKFDIDYLKIDQSFVRNLATGSQDLVLCEAIIVMAHKLGIKVVAEGVETVEHRHLLAEAGCDYAQGYLYSRPIPPEEFEKLLFPQK